MTNAISDRKELDEKAYATFASGEGWDLSVKAPEEFYDRYIKEFVPGKDHSLLFRIVKRTFDILASFFGLCILAIPFAVIACLIKLDSKGPVFFRNERVGRGGKHFYCLKFRSMSTEAPKDVASSLFTDSASYVTKIGKFLRKTSLDELPQLINVLLGEMSIVGYRPLVPTETKCNAMRDALGVFRMRPGITGYAQVRGRDDVYYRNKAILDATYVKGASLAWDLKLLFQTVAIVFTHKGNRD